MNTSDHRNLLVKADTDNFVDDVLVSSSSADKLQSKDQDQETVGKRETSVNRRLQGQGNSNKRSEDKDKTNLSSAGLWSTPQDQDDKAKDPFMYFSSDKRRMEHLLGKELPRVPRDTTTQRKRRISFELDPLYLITANFPELFDEDFDESVIDRFFGEE